MDAHRGIKRKRAASDDLHLVVRRKLHHELREVKKAAKRARTLELMKVVKRLKWLRSKGNNTSELEDLEAQIHALKHFDIDIVGSTAFTTRVRKRKSLCSNEHVKAAIESELSSNILSPEEPGTPSYKAQSKLLSSKTLAQKITASMQMLEMVVFPQDRETRFVIGKEKVIGPPGSQAASLVVQGSTTACDTEVEPGRESGSVDEAEWESGSVKTVSASEDEVTASSDEDVQSNTKSNPRVIKVSGLQSTFLPALSVGFVRGDSSDSDWEADADIAEPSKKKNRRGQRARRAIWEKKYGRNANHKKKEIEQQRPSDRKQKTNGNTNSKRHGQNHYVQNPNTKLRTDKSKKYAESSAPRAEDKGPLHPSWEAKKQLRDKMKPNIVPSQGKKIVF